ncbi:MAG: isoamylase [Myxococcales bacterium]
MSGVPPGDWFGFEGSPSPLGATLTPDSQAYNFALYSAAASSVTLHFYRAAEPALPLRSLVLDPGRNKSGSVWHARVRLSDVIGAQYYAYTVDGPNAAGGRFDSSKVLLDPYATAVFFPPGFSRDAARAPGSNAGRAPLGELPKPRPPFDWGNDASPRHTSNTVIYEMHVKGFTNDPSSGVPAARRGTYLGVIDKIPYLLDLGVTVVELMPIFLYDPEPGGNYWGYMPLSFFAPHRGYSNAADPADTLDELRTLVKALHAANIEVILDVVYNHTTEQGADGPTYSYRGIDNAGYYLLGPDQSYLDFTGCGNSLATSEPVVRRLIVDSLRYWVSECHIDGFRFDLAGIFSRTADGSIDREQPPIIEEINSDPLLANTRLIAEPYDLKSYELGRSFPGHTWLQWNASFRDTVRRFVRGDNDTISDLMTRLYGSELDLFPADLGNANHAYQSVNFVDCHDGFCLYDLVSYDSKHNQANGAGHEGGVDDNLSNNCGFEGDVAPPDVLSLRKLRIKGFFALLMLANGTPMFVMGDELLRSQGGNNNAYNQDNQTSWLNWDLLAKNADMYRFFKALIAFRKAHPSLARSRFWGSDITWYGVQGNPDQGFTSHTLAFCLNDPQGFGSPSGPGNGHAGPSLYVLANFYEKPLSFDIQQGSAGSWRRVIDTSLASPDDVADPGTEPVLGSLSYVVNAQSVVVLVSS